MTDLPHYSGDALIISHDNIPFTAYQAIYHKVTRKVEVLSRRYKEAYRIDYDDIKNLTYRLKQVLAQYAVKGQRLQIAHSIKDGFSTTYSSFEKFSKADFSQRECTSALDLELDFLIVLPAEIPQAESIAQRYKLNLTFQRVLKDDDDDIFAPYFMDMFRLRSQFFMRLEYSDYSVAQTLNATVESWVKGLPKTEVSPVVKWVMKREEVAQRYVGILFGLVAPASATVYFANNQMDVSSGLALALIAFILFQASSSAISHVVEAGYALVRRISADTEVVLTKGDEDRLARNKKSAGKARGYLTFALVTVLLSLLINLLSSWLYDRMF